MMKKLAIIHYMPLEFYPPIINVLDVLSLEDKLKIKVWSTDNNKQRKKYKNKIYKISRVSFPNLKDSRIIRLLKYFLFNLNCFFGLVIQNPDKIVYFETYSAWPVYWYLKLFGKYKQLFIHYHEYSSPEWYMQNMVLIKRYHQLEKQYLFKKAMWISHTNLDRVGLFLKDHKNVSAHQMQVLPNYPPLKWQKHYKKVLRHEDSITKLVYVGSLSLTSTYLKEFCNWVIDQKGAYTFNIYAFNLHDDTIEFLNNLNTELITFHEKGLDYDAIPQTLSNYDIGIVFYKNYSDNVTYCAPNKLFEYMACGLTVWYAKGLEGIKPYQSEQVKPVDFEALDSANLFNPSIFEKKKEFCNQFNAEHALKPLIVELGN